MTNEIRSEKAIDITTLKRWEEDVRNRTFCMRLSAFKVFHKEVLAPFGLSYQAHKNENAAKSYVNKVEISSSDTALACTFSSLIDAARWAIYKYHRFDARMREEALRAETQQHQRTEQGGDFHAAILAKFDVVIDMLGEIEKAISAGGEQNG